MSVETLTVWEVAPLVQVSRDTVYRLVRRGEFRARKVGSARGPPI